MTSTPEGTVHIVDPEKTTRRSMSFLLRELGYVVKAYGSLDDFLSTSDGSNDACLLLDLPPPGSPEAEESDWRRGLRIDLPVIIMSGSGDTATAVEALKAGASDFIAKPFRKSVLLGALAAAFAKHRDGRLAEGCEAARMCLEALTPRELDVLRGLARGCSNKVIAYELGISPRTVEIHRGHMMKHLGARSVSHALRIAFAAGLESDRTPLRPSARLADDRAGTAL